jgi:hypothetical protein
MSPRVEHAERAAHDHVTPLRHYLSRRHRGLATPGRFALVDVIGSPYARISRVSPSCGVTAPRTPPSGPRSRRGHAPLAAGQDERQRPGPMRGREARRGGGEVKSEAADHLAARDEQEERFRCGPALHADERLDAVVVTAVPKP